VNGDVIVIESLTAIRQLGLAPIFETLYFGKDVPAAVAIYMRYPDMFRNLTPAQSGALTKGGLVPIVDDGNGDSICLFDPERLAFVVKFVEEPDRIAREFVSWQQYLAYALLGIADSGAGDEELQALSETVGFLRTRELLGLLHDIEALPDRESGERCERFIEASAPPRV